MSETILQEAQRLVHGDRGDSYGAPIDDFTRTGKLWAAILDVSEVTAEQVGLCMAAVKISRQCNKPKRDNMTDLAGYAETVQMVVEERERRYAHKGLCFSCGTSDDCHTPWCALYCPQ